MRVRICTPHGATSHCYCSCYALVLRLCVYLFCHRAFEPTALDNPISTTEDMPKVS